MINENPLTKHIFLSLIENQYYKDNHQLISEIGNLNAYNSPIIINKDGEIVNNIDKDPPSSDNESSKDISSESEIEEISKNEKIPKNEENQKKLIFENPFFTTEETIYDDLNYGDFVLACQNPLYHYQIPERIRSIVHFKTVNQKLGKKINLSKKVKYWLKQLKKQEGVNLENIKVDSLFSKYNSKGNQVMDQTDIDKDVIKHVDVKQIKDDLDRCSPKKAWISLEEAGKIYDICIGSNRGTFLGDGEGDESYFGLKELHQ